jgi:hypothetical protein
LASGLTVLLKRLLKAEEEVMITFGVAFHREYFSIVSPLLSILDEIPHKIFFKSILLKFQPFGSSEANALE